MYITVERFNGVMHQCVNGKDLKEEMTASKALATSQMILCSHFWSEGMHYATVAYVYYVLPGL